MPTGFGWIVFSNARWEQANRRTARHRVRETAAGVFRDFTALPVTASKSAFRDVPKGRAAEFTAFDAHTGRTGVLIRVHEYPDTRHARLAHLRRCFAYTLMSPDPDRPTYREVKRTAGWSVWDLAV
ncbi:hypothetical protein ACFQ08_06345 [Streptosporangium algeriense]|uniref:Uncharacterized protein n=1 Tax=Streptosporangium algeriense TaxID=1682748 RepID=A0ABW3DNG0_9ACTN